MLVDGMSHHEDRHLLKVAHGTTLLVEAAHGTTLLVLQMAHLTTLLFLEMVHGKTLLDVAHGTHLLEVVHGTTQLKVAHGAMMSIKVAHGTAMLDVARGTTLLELARGPTRTLEVRTAHGLMMARVKICWQIMTGFDSCEIWSEVQTMKITFGTKMKMHGVTMNLKKRKRKTTMVIPSIFGASRDVFILQSALVAYIAHGIGRRYRMLKNVVVCDATSCWNVFRLAGCYVFRIQSMLNSSNRRSLKDWTLSQDIASSHPFPCGFFRT